MSYTNFFRIERLDHWRSKLRQSNSGGLCFVVAYVVSRFEGTLPATLSHPKTT
jgi:hypothetical protein